MTGKQSGRIAVTLLVAAAVAVTAGAAHGAAKAGVPNKNTGTTNFVVTPSAVQPGNGDLSLDFSGDGTYSGTISGTFTTVGTQIVHPDLSTDVQASASITGEARNCTLTNFPLSYSLTGYLNADHSATYSGSGSGTAADGTVLRIWLWGVQPATGTGTFAYRAKVHCGSRDPGDDD